MNRIRSIYWMSALCLFGSMGGFARDRVEIPAVEREFRAVWVATVANIDWPSKPGLSTEEQKKEALAILDKVQELNMNAVVFQVRAQADAFYASDLEPWSYFLTGAQGKAPEPFYDPLEFWVEQAHARGLELHAWFNPYRAAHPSMRGELADSSIINTSPELVRPLGSQGYYWMVPTTLEVQKHSFDVVMDVLERYDVDGLHFDDYFYPYESYNDGKDFPDDPEWRQYKESGGILSRGDWRRDAVNTFIRQVYVGTKERKPHVKFGLSPFGIWRPGYPASIQGLDQYNSLYADARLWLNQGWVDYYTPQLYWQISRIAQSFPVLLGWWSSENHKNRHLWPGMSIGQARQETGAKEIINQVMVTRGMVPEGPGHCFFSMRTLQANQGGLNEALLEGPYRRQALIPASPWLDNVPPEAPDVKAGTRRNQVSIEWAPADPGDVFLWVVHLRKDNRWNYQILPADVTEFKITEDRDQYSAVAVQAVDRVGNLSDPKIVRF